MGYDISFRTTELISPPLQAEVVEHARSSFSAWSWVRLTKPDLENEDGYLVGDVRVSPAPHPDDIADCRTGGQPDVRLSDLLAAICDVSRFFDIDWGFSHDHGELGYVRAGRPDPDLRDFCDGFNEMIDAMEDSFDPDDLDDVD